MWLGARGVISMGGAEGEAEGLSLRELDV